MVYTQKFRENDNEKAYGMLNTPSAIFIGNASGSTTNNLLLPNNPLKSFADKKNDHVEYNSFVEDFMNSVKPDGSLTTDNGKVMVYKIPFYNRPSSATGEKIYNFSVFGGNVKPAKTYYVGVISGKVNILTVFTSMSDLKKYYKD